MDDEFDDFIDELKKYFKIDSDYFDIDFLFMPDSEIGLKKDIDNKKFKAFKISYHFETGMKKPEVRIEGNIDYNEIKDYLKNVDLSKYPQLKKNLNIKSKKEIDAGKLSLEFHESEVDIDYLEPYIEIMDNNNFFEILLEIPGMNEDDVRINISEDHTQLLFIAEKKNRKYKKSITIPFKCSKENCLLNVNNGIAIIRVSKKINN